MGLPTTEYHKKNVIKATIQEIYEKFMLVLIFEHFDESLLLLKRKLCWRLDDVLYLRCQYAKDSTYKLSPQSVKLKHMIKTWNSADSSLYQFFNETLWEEIKYEGPNFWIELREFRVLLGDLSCSCENKQLSKQVDYIANSHNESQPTESKDSLRGLQNQNNIHTDLSINETSIHRDATISHFRGSEEYFQVKTNYTKNDLTGESKKNQMTQHLKTSMDLLFQKKYYTKMTSKVISGSDYIARTSNGNYHRNYRGKFLQSGYIKNKAENKLENDLYHKKNSKYDHWNSYICKKLATDEQDYLDYFRRKLHYRGNSVNK